jgi:hypothetical protein
VIYDVGDVALIQTELRDAGGTLAAATVTLDVIKPDGTVLTPPLVVLDNGGTGKYRAFIPLTVTGTWRYLWMATGAVSAADGGDLAVFDAGRLASAASHIGASPDDPLLARLLMVAVTLVGEYLGADGLLSCPAIVRDHAINQLASELFTRRNSPGGVVWAPGGDNVTRLSRDALISVAPLLRPYAELGIA